MAPLVVIRAGAKEIEYRDRSRRWTRTAAAAAGSRGLRHCPHGEDDTGDHDHELRDAYYCACDAEDRDSEYDEDDEDDVDEDDEEDSQDGGKPAAIYGFSTELYELGGMRVFRCADCGNVVGDRDDIIAKSFFGRTGKAYLMNAMFNVTTGSPRNRYLMTGMHTICDVMCGACEAVLGWKYVRAMELSQKYKEGKFIMERAVVQDSADANEWGRP